VKRRVSFRVKHEKSQGVAQGASDTRDDVRTQGGDTIWRHGGRPDEDYAYLYPEDDSTV
jgi:hypothetical protein